MNIKTITSVIYLLNMREKLHERGIKFKFTRAEWRQMPEVIALMH